MTTLMSHYGNVMAVDALVTLITKASAATILTLIALITEHFAARITSIMWLVE